MKNVVIYMSFQCSGTSYPQLILHVIINGIETYYKISSKLNSKLSTSCTALNDSTGRSYCYQLNYLINTDVFLVNSKIGNEH